MEGTIGARPVRGSGAPSTRGPREASADSVRPPHRVLAIADDRTLRAFLVEALADQGYDARAIGRRAGAAAASAPSDDFEPDLIVLDSASSNPTDPADPSGPGRATRPPAPAVLGRFGARVPIILLTTAAGPDTAGRGSMGSQGGTGTHSHAEGPELVRYGYVDAYLAKPFDLPTLYETVRGVLARR